jgi:hypothetical protein
MEARSGPGNHMDHPALPPGWSVVGSSHASRSFLTLFCYPPGTLLLIPGGGEDTKNGEKVQVGGTTPGRDGGT